MRVGLVNLTIVAVALALQGSVLAQQAGSSARGPAGQRGGGVHQGASVAAPPRGFVPAPPGLSGHNPAPHWPSWQRQEPQNSHHGRSDHDDHRWSDRSQGPGLYAGYPWLGYGYALPWGEGSAYGDDVADAGIAAPAPQSQVLEPPADERQAAAAAEITGNGAAATFRPPYQQQPEFAPVHAQPTTTLIFNDGRPPMQVHNYALTATTLYALDGDTRREISLSVLNIAATIKANRAAGVDFALPGTN